MKLTPKTIALTTSAALGTLGCFLPFIGGMTLSAISEMHGFNKPSLGMFLVPFVILFVLAALSLGVFERVARWQGIVGALISALVVTLLDGAGFWGRFRPAGVFELIAKGDIGAKLVSVGALAALVTCSIATVKPDPKVA
ncbi:MAG TPA: hypothetical protein VGM39_04165 [Kofleriaceae bacterium]|jgi:hypothetical protein